jgi:hypothetical protein
LVLVMDYKMKKFKFQHQSKLNLLIDEVELVSNILK